MQLDDVGHVVGVVHGLLVGDVEVDGDAEVAAADDDGGRHQVEGENGQHEGEALVLHLRPGQGAGQAEGLGAVAAPAQDGEQGPDQAVEPDPHAHDFHRPPGDLLVCSGREEIKDVGSYPSYLPRYSFSLHSLGLL